jgi:hypothetical protein
VWPWKWPEMTADSPLLSCLTQKMAPLSWVTFLSSHWLYYLHFSPTFWVISHFLVTISPFPEMPNIYVLNFNPWVFSPLSIITLCIISLA